MPFNDLKLRQYRKPVTSSSLSFIKLHFKFVEKIRIGIAFAVLVQTLFYLLNSLNKRLNFCVSVVSPSELFSTKLMWVMIVQQCI